MWKIGVYITITGVLVGASIAIAVAFLVFKLKKNQQTGFRKEKDLELQQLSLSVRTTSDKKVSFEGSQDPFDNRSIEVLTPRKLLTDAYTEEELQRATEDFSSSNLIEGSVYHGRLVGKNLAVKKTKAEAIAKIEMGLFINRTHHHPNILRLLGTCIPEGDSDGFLIFEYAKNGSLKDWLHGGLAMKNQFIASCYCFLTWNQRMRICLDVASALQYMHQILNPSHVHRNLKSQNIFLDEDFNAKLGNFGMAKCVEDDTNDSDTSFANSANRNLAYLAPEYLHRGVISPKVDIFAYGVVLLEVLSGQTPTSRPGDKKEGGGNVWVSEKINSILSSENTDELKEWMDNAIGENYSFDAAVALCHLARACVHENPLSRPNAAEIVDKLSRLVEESEDGENMSICESSCKPLVKAAASSL